MVNDVVIHVEYDDISFRKNILDVNHHDDRRYYYLMCSYLQFVDIFFDVLVVVEKVVLLNVFLVFPRKNLITIKPMRIIEYMAKKMDYQMSDKCHRDPVTFL